MGKKYIIDGNEIREVEENNGGCGFGIVFVVLVIAAFGTAIVKGLSIVLYVIAGIVGIVLVIAIIKDIKKLIQRRKNNL